MMKLFGWLRKAQPAPDQQGDYYAFNERMRGEGWVKYLVRQPNPSTTVEYYSFYWEAPVFCASEEFYSQMNVADLWWRPVQHEIDGHLVEQIPSFTPSQGERGWTLWSRSPC